MTISRVGNILLSATIVFMCLVSSSNATPLSYEEWRQARVDDFTSRHNVGDIYDGLEITGYVIVFDGVWSGSYGDRDPNDIYAGPVYSDTIAFDGTSYNVTVGWDAKPHSSPVPEPASLVLMILGLIALGFTRYRYAGAGNP